MRQAQPHNPRSGRMALAALAGAVLAILVIPDGTTVCSKEAKPDGKLPICAE